MIDTSNHPTQKEGSLTPSKKTVKLLKSGVRPATGTELLAQLSGLRARYLDDMKAARDKIKKNFLT